MEKKPQGHGKKKHGDFSKFIKKKQSKPTSSFKKSKDGTSKVIKEKSKPAQRTKKPLSHSIGDKEKQTSIRLNKYLANAGICSRREADQLIESGVVKINGKVVTELGVKVSYSDKVQYDGRTLLKEKPVYVLLNKPKDFITTVTDPFERKTVMNLVARACKERIYPVGRLDRNTTGLLLFTNDGELAKKLTHPKHGIKKIYHIVLDKSLAKNDIVKIASGVMIDDGLVKVDKIAYIEGQNDKKQIGVEIHSGKNRIIRRIFESLDYRVVKLDRVVFAGLTKKDLPRGKWRHLKQEEINILRMKG
ncbi:MAG: rRNA pseudouridine synthase [Bacteroidales bacterium]|nr:rRNA pseudouridine synthase [Bacteroidales bacterium]